MLDMTHRTLIREWRRYRVLTLERLAERIGVSHSYLGRVERGERPYNQRLLEDLAVALATEPADLLSKNPEDPEGILAVWRSIPPTERARALEILKTFVRTATG